MTGLQITHWRSGMANDDEGGKKARELAAKNIRLAIILGILAVGFYVLFIMGYAR